MNGLAPTNMGHSPNELEFDFETLNVNLRDTILIPMQAGRGKSLEDMDITDFGLVRYSETFPLRYAGVIPMRFLQRWEDGITNFKNWAYGNWDEPERITMEDIYSILNEIDEVGAKSLMNRNGHALFMGNMVKMRDFVACVANKERDIKGDDKAKEVIIVGKEEIGIKPE